MTRWSRRELRAWLRFIAGSRALFAALDRQLRRDAGISHDEYEVLVALGAAPAGRLRMSALAGETSLSPSRLTHTVTRFEEAGWVARVADPEDRRGTLAVLTEEGRRFLVEATAGHVPAVRAMVFDPLSPSQLEQLQEIFVAVRDAVRRYERRS